MLLIGTTCSVSVCYISKDPPSSSFLENSQILLPTSLFQCWNVNQSLGFVRHFQTSHVPVLINLTDLGATEPPFSVLP